MRTAYLCLLTCVAAGTAPGLPAQAPRSLGVTINGETEAAEPLAVDQWHTITARYQYPGKIDRLTNTFLVIARGQNLLSGWDIGYNLPANELMIIKHGFWNATEATGHPGEAGKIIENDQGYLDCEHTTVVRTADEITVSYRLKFKPGVLRGAYNVFLYVEDRDLNHHAFTPFTTITIGDEALVHRSDMPKEWRNALRPKGNPSPALLLADAGRARYVVVIPREPKPIETKAAADLSRHLEWISGADFAILREDQLRAKDTPYISIGRTDLLARAKARWKSADLAPEEYALEVVGGNVYLYGGPGRGLMHGVYSLLEEDLGCRWYSTNSVDTPRRRRLRARLVSRRYAPVLELRDPYILSMHDPNWSLRNKTNSPQARVPLAWGGSLRYYHLGHTYNTYFPPQQYFAEHPEYYALVNGKRQPSQLCHTNEEVIRLSIEKTLEIFRNNPEVTITAIGPNDGRGFCDCPNCKKLDDENGGRSGSFFYFVNRIAEGVKQEFPNNHLISLAYLDYAKPPTKLKVDPYIIIQLCTDSHAWKYQFCNVWESQEYQEIVKAWHARNAKVYLWDYTTDYVHYLVPMANWAVVAGNTRFNIRHGVRGIMYESEANDCDEMRAWVWAKQLWNPELDTKALMKDFVFGYYKEAAAPIWDYQMAMWAYWEKWHKQPHKCGEPSDNPLLNNLHCSYAPDGPMFTPEFMAHMRRCFETAERLAQSEVIRARVGRAKLPLLYLELGQHLGYYSEFGDFIYGKSIRQPRAEKQAFLPLLQEFTDLCKQNELSTLGISGSVEKITNKWHSCIESESASLPKMHLPAEWIFAADPDDRGAAERWYADRRYYDAATKRAKGAPAASLGKGLTVLHINRGVGWEQQGFPGFDGYGWYFQTLRIPDDLAGKKHLYLHFLAVNEQAWVYINGELAHERSYASTGKGVGELAGAPLSFDAKQWLKPGVENTLAIRVMHSSGLGGIWLPAMLFGTDAECSVQELDQLRY